MANVISTTVCATVGAEFEVIIYVQATMAAILFLMGILTVVLNAIYLTAMYKYSSDFSASDICYVSLSISDVLTGMIVLPGFGVFWIIHLVSDTNCILYNYLSLGTHILTSVSLVTIILITAELYVSVIHPFKYEKYVTKRRLFWINFLIWCFLATSSFANSFSPVVQQYTNQSVAGAIVFCLVIFLIFLHVRINSEIEKMRKRIRHHSIEAKESIKNKKKALAMSVSVMSLFSVCFLPSSFCVIYITLAGPSKFAATYLLSTTAVISQLSALLNPFMYYFRLRRIRLKVRKLFKRGINSNVVSEASNENTRNTFH